MAIAISGSDGESGGLLSRGEEFCCGLIRGTETPLKLPVMAAVLTVLLCCCLHAITAAEPNSKKVKPQKPPHLTGCVSTNMETSAAPGVSALPEPFKPRICAFSISAKTYSVLPLKSGGNVLSTALRRHTSAFSVKSTRASGLSTASSFTLGIKLFSMMNFSSTFKILWNRILQLV
ncbi:hypothetical protein OJAV_G00235220 [Oryzias javanicus]|uniref:Uncharacterized protein n=1 Tax=Oryzias javanicus TaxID=123683 RepID=A0A3S2NNK8_ORYJA|nr:hypothetical protein OJAV_G00235220 [Oryzias javanicus]